MRNLYAVTTSAMRDTVAARAHAFTWAELVAMSSASSVRRAVAAGELVRLLPGVYAGAEHAASFAARADAAVLWAGEGAALSAESALWVWGVTETAPRVVEVTVPHETRLRPPEWLRMRRVSSPVRTSRVDRLCVVSPADALVQAFGLLPVRERATTVFTAIGSRLVGTAQVREALARTPRVRARRALVRLLESVDQGAQSFLEAKGLATVFNTKDFARLIPQHQIVLEGRVYRFDLFDPVSRTAFELDSAAHHGKEDDRIRDIHRDAHCATAGILTVRFGYQQIVNDPLECRRIAIEVMRSRSPRR